MKASLALLVLISSQAMALSNADLCGDKVKGIAQQIRSISSKSVSVKSTEFKGDLAGVQQIDGIYEATFNNDLVAEIRLDQNCSVLEYRLK